MKRCTGAVTTKRTPVPGCRVQPLGVMRYIPVASKSYIKRHLTDGFTGHAVAAAPSLAWNRDDALQDELVSSAFRRHIARPQHFVPTAEGFAAAVRRLTYSDRPSSPARAIPSNCASPVAI